MNISTEIRLNSFVTLPEHYFESEFCKIDCFYVIDRIKNIQRINTV